MSETVTASPSGGAGQEAGAEASRQAEQKKSKSKLKLIIVAAVVLLLLVGGGVFAWQKGLFSSHKAGSVASKDGKSVASNMHTSIMLGIPTIVSNLDSGDGRPVYVKITAKVEIADAVNEASLQNRIPEIQDIFQTYLHETRPQDIRGDGIYRLREAVLRRLRATLAPLQVTNVYLVEFLVQ
ncbi:flagellar basal body-associated FliL family protein [Acetobacter vaccinii]|uniref:Flagellar protein FliL n=1 Tax=Acetobacter vaccinii TaxID=2592655 RepID=A0A5C1YQ06_9PROT|nr:flagellar basal body-associated FliL family protein [Acetobacter vaccinii]QEO16882.1 flagellar basal body-associated protein FliL [Acetobacter vaccinii]